MQNIKWLGFSLPGVKTIIHFLPAAINISAPYPVFAKLTIFNESFGKRSVSLEGPRLGHPDGIRLDSAFPDTGEESLTSFGVLVELFSKQPYISLAPSNCIFEFVQNSHSVRFMPKLLISGKNSLPEPPYRSSEKAVGSYMVVNGGMSSCKFPRFLNSPELNGRGFVAPFDIAFLEELELTGDALPESVPQETGTSNAVYVLYFERLSRSLLSVMEI